MVSDLLEMSKKCKYLSSHYSISKLFIFAVAVAIVFCCKAIKYFIIIFLVKYHFVVCLRSHHIVISTSQDTVGAHNQKQYGTNSDFSHTAAVIQFTISCFDGEAICSSLLHLPYFPSSLM